LRQAIITPISPKATIAFFSVVKKIGSPTAVTAIFVTKLFVPEMTAAKSASKVADFMRV